MWMSKIKKYFQELDRTPVLNAVFVFSMLCITLVFVFAVINGVKQILGLESTEKIISSISSIATALTLLFLVYQHKVNDSKNYQVAMVEESKLVIEKIIEQLEQVQNWDGSNLETLDGIMIEISNHAVDFNDFHDEVKDSALKKIMRVRWQDMYFNHYDPAFLSLNVFTIIRKNSLGGLSYINELISELKEESRGALHESQNLEYEKTLYCVCRAKEKGLFDIPNEISSHRNFKKYFIEDDIIGKYLEDAGYSANPRERYPSLCAIVEVSINSR